MGPGKTDFTMDSFPYFEPCDSHHGLISYKHQPVAAESWLSKTSNEEDYNVAYSQDLSGEEIYTSDDEWEDKMDAAQKAALSYFKKAGYTVEVLDSHDSAATG